MAIKTGKLSGGIPMPGKIQFIGDTCNFVFDVSKWDDELSEWAKQPEEEREGSLLRGILERLLLSWDVLDDHDQPIPTTEAAMVQYHLPTPFLNAILAEMNAAVAPGKLTRAQSHP